MGGCWKLKDKTFTAEEVAWLASLNEMADQLWDMHTLLVRLEVSIEESRMTEKDPRLERLTDITDMQDEVAKLQDELRDEYLKMRYEEEE